MSQFYKILKADPLGDPWTPDFEGAKSIQNYWCQVEGEELAVSIGKQVPNTVTPGEYVYGDLIKALSQKSGNPYWKFKSQKVPEGVTRPASTPAQATAQAAVGGDAMPQWFTPIYNMLQSMQKDLKDLKGIDDELSGTATGVAKAEEPEPIDEETKKAIDDIFSPDDGDVEPPEPAPKDEPEGDK